MRRMDFCSWAAAASVALCWPAAAHAQDTKLVDQLLRQHRVSDVTFSPTGKQIAYVVSEPARGKDRRANIWVYDVGSGATRRLTFGSKQDQKPRWSPNGENLAFISSRNGQPQAYLLSLHGGEAEPLPSENLDVTDIQWSPQGDAIAFTGKKPDPKPKSEGGRDELVQSQAGQSQRLGLIRLGNRKIQWVLDAARWSVGLFSWMPDGAHIVATASDEKRPGKTIDTLFEIGLTGEMRQVGRLAGVELDQLQVSPDGRYAAFVGANAGPVAHDVLLQPIAGGPAQDLTGPTSRARIDRPATDLHWTDVGTLAFSVKDGLGNAIYSLSVRDGRASKRRTFADAEISSFAADRNQMAYVKTTSVSPPEIEILKDGRELQITHLHPSFPHLASPRLIKYRTSDGFEIEAQLYAPPGQVGRAPLVVLVHGGPSARWSFAINNWAQLLVSEGFAVLAPNIRGSEGYGAPFLHANRDDWGGGDFRDIQTGIDELVSQGVADPDRLGIAGWSYGGYMSAWAVTQTSRFKAAVVGAAVLDLAVEWGTEAADGLPYDTWYLGTPWERKAEFARMSPLSHANRVRTPTLILVGENDPVDPIAQDWQFYRALRISNVETEMVVYPREEHHIEEEDHSRDVLTRMVRWMTAHLTTPQPAPAGAERP